MGPWEEEEVVGGSRKHEVSIKSVKNYMYKGIGTLNLYSII